MMKCSKFLAGLTLAIVALATPFMPQVRAQSLTDYGENKSVDTIIRGQTAAFPATWYVGLDTVACTDAGGGTEVSTSGTGYARASIAASLANWAGTQGAGTTSASTGTGGQTSNNIAITFPPPTGNWTQVLSFRMWDAASGGNAWFCQTLTNPKTINSGDAAPSFAIGAMTFTFQ